MGRSFIVPEIQLIRRKSIVKETRNPITMTTKRNDNGLRFGTYNVKTLYSAGKLALAAKILENYNLAFMGMSEVRWNTCGQFRTPKGHVFYWSGMPNENDIHQYGVGVLVNAKFRDAVIDYKFIDERSMWLRLKGRSRNVTIIQCYAPTEEADDCIKDAFYDKLNNTLSEIPKKDLTLLIGDFNAKVGSENDQIEHIIGKHGIGDINDNGGRLVEFCGLHGLKIGGTLFPHKLIHKITWVSPDQRTQNQIDHICVTAKWSNCLTDVRNKRSADISSDHHLVVGKLHLNLIKAPKSRTCNRVKYKVAKLKSPNVRESFALTLDEKLTPVENLGVQQSWNKIKTAINETCMETLGKASSNKNESDDYISAQTWSLIDKRAKMKKDIIALNNPIERKRAQADYNQLDKRIKREIREDKKQYMNNLASVAEQAAATNNMKVLFDTTKFIANSGVKRTVPIRNLDGELLTNVEDQLRRWKEHFAHVLNLDRDGIAITHENNVEVLPIRTDPPSKREIIQAIKSLKTGKAAGIDNIPAEVFKANIQLMVDILHPLFRSIWETETYPSDWLRGIIVKIPKKGDLTNCNNWRGITMLCVVMKVFMKIILERLIKLVDAKLRPEQAGFRSGRSCVDHINSLRIIIEQSIEMRSPLYLLFIDYEKAFDAINRKCIWAELKNIGVPDKLVSIIEKSYEQFECSVLHENRTSEPFRTISGVRQGCVLSPLLFLVVLDAVVKRANNNKPRGIVFNPLIPAMRLESLDYADDKCELSHCLNDMQQKLDDLALESTKVGLKINVDKTKEMRINARSAEPLKLLSHNIERVSEFQYLGSVVAENGGTEQDVQSRIRKALGAFTKLHNIWSSNGYSLKTKIKIFKACVLSVLLYGCETWFVTEKIQNKLRVFVNRCLRKILRVFWPNRISNEELWSRTNFSDVNTEIRKRKFRWIGHTLRKAPDEICHRALEYNPQGSRRRGRPRTTWRRSTLNEINTALQTQGGMFNSITEARVIALRRERWKRLIDSLCPV